MRRAVAFVLPLLLVSAACKRDAANGSAESATTGTSVEKPGAKAVTIDSALPREEELRRFRVDLPEVTELANSFPSRDALVTAYVKRLGARDTAHLSELGLTKAEFAWLYYPSSPIGKPPYDLSPGLMYFQFEGNSRKGLFHALGERGGTDLKIVGFNCATTEKQGENTLLAQCLFKRLQAPGDTLSEILFGGIIERHGRFKILNFANKF